MVRKKKAPPGFEELQNGMTVKLGDGSGDEGVKKLGKRAAVDEESLQGADGETEDRCSSKNPTKEEVTFSTRSSTKEIEQASSPVQPSQTQDQHHFLRSSVRPQSKRLRKDSVVSCAAATSTNSVKGKGTDNGGPSSSCLSGIPASSLAGSSKSASRNLVSSTGEKEEGNKKKVRRQWESWSTEDKNTFFEGLYEHGKDFEAIQNNIALKYKKKGKPANMVKNKEQVRHFYYRTWHKISKYIDFDNVFSRGLKKSSQELYGLICYGELRKKIGGCMDDKNAAKLNELIQLGATTVRYKGRNLRIKAPMCRALKKLCDPDGLSDEEDQKPVRLPLKVPVELQPRNNHAWARVQSLAQNPRLRMIVELHRKVSSLIEFLKQKWALPEVRVRKTLEEHQLQDIRDVDVQEQPFEDKMELHLFPGENSTFAPLPGVARVVHSKAFCTVHWQETGKCKQNTKDSLLLPPAQILGIQSGQGTARVQLKYPRGAGEGKGSGREENITELGKSALFSLDSMQNTEENNPEGELSEGTTLNLSTLPILEKHSDSDEHLDKQSTVSPLTESSKTLSCGPMTIAVPCTKIPDLEELSLLDPFPRYMKSCHDLIVPERCFSTDTLCVKEGPSSTTSASPADLSSGSAEATNLDLPFSAGTGTSYPNSGSPAATESTNTNCQGTQPNLCTRELTDATVEDSQEKQTVFLLPPISQGQLATKPREDPSQLAQQVREEGWNLQSSENLTLAEVYLMLGKPSKLQLEYDWIVSSRSATQTSGEQNSDTSASRSATFYKQRLLSCLLRLITTEVNPKSAPETNTVAASPLKSIQEDQDLTPPGKVITLASRSPGCARNQTAIRSCKACSPTSSISGLRNSSGPLATSTSRSGSNDADGGVFAVPTTLPPNSRHGKMFSSGKESESTFRHHLDTISSDFLLPKPRKFRNRHLRKPLVVQRTLLPRPSGNASPHVCSFSILSNSSVAGKGSFRPIQSSLTKATVSRPIVPKVVPTPASNHLSGAIDLAAESAGIIPESPLPLLEAESIPGIAPLSPDTVSSVATEQDSAVESSSSITAAETPNNRCQVPFIALSTPTKQERTSSEDLQAASALSLSDLSKVPPQNGLSTPPHPLQESNTHLSPPNVSALLDISLPGPPEDVLSQGEPATQISDSIIEIAISSGQYGDGVSLSPAKLNGSDSSKSLPSPSSSPHQNWIASPTHDPQWYPNDSTDSSLSSLFSSFISPEKGRKMLPTPTGTASGTSLLGPSLLDGNSRDSFVSRSLADVSEVDSQLACMMNENSIDYISRFNDLAQELSITEPSRREILFDGGSGGPPIGDLS
uniref:Protein cramped-like n=1 Tax=Geotrypetes seraphini TaxID=260995 RepID=A0A6P8SJ99_GEOSA|nr:protein cramped-like isoform X2 [Geotrypetes seraphini]